MKRLLARARRWWQHGHMRTPRIPRLPDTWQPPQQPNHRTYVKDVQP